MATCGHGYNGEFCHRSRKTECLHKLTTYHLCLFVFSKALNPISIRKKWVGLDRAIRHRQSVTFWSYANTIGLSTIHGKKSQWHTSKCSNRRQKEPWKHSILNFLLVNFWNICWRLILCQSKGLFSTTSVSQYKILRVKKPKFYTLNFWL